MKNLLKNFSWLAGVLAVTLFVLSAGMVRAATPTLSLAGNSDGDTVQVSVTGTANSTVILSYTKTNVGSQLTSIGTTDSSGNFSVNISSSGYGIAAGSTVSVLIGGINGVSSNSVNWPNVTTTGSFSLSQTGVVLTVGQSANVTAYNSGSGLLYLSNNSNPPIANINISGSQITVNALSYGSSVASICYITTSSTVTVTPGTNCASMYITVTQGTVQPLTFSVSNVTLATGQSVPVTISGGSGTYTVLNNSNSSAVGSNISGSTVTLVGTGTSGSSAVTVCSSNMSSCGIINVTIGTSTTVPLAFSQQNPTLSVGQTLVVGLSGGSSTSYYLSNNSNTTAVTATITGSNLQLIGNVTGVANLTVCSSSGSCGTVTASVSYVSNGGSLQLSQTNLSLLTGQVLSVTVSGGTSPYTLNSNSSSIFSSSLNGNIITISGLGAGSSTLNVCSAGGACATLSVTVNSSGAGGSVTFSQNNVSVVPAGTAAVTISGNGGYYVSNSSNPSVASVQISGSAVTITGIAAGTDNISICQSGGQCGILFVNVNSSASNTNVLPNFSVSSPTLTVGQTMSVIVSGGLGTNYYLSTNSSPSSVSAAISGNTLTITGQSVGNSVLSVCAASTSCGSLSVAVATQSSALSYPSTNTPPAASSSVSTTLGSSQAGSLNNGELISENGTIYIVYKNTKVPFTNPTAFLGLGFKFANVVSVTNSGLTLSDRSVITASGAHPRGTWLLSGKMVYFLTPDGLIPVPSWDVFLSNGGQSNYLAKANNNDLHFSKLATMTAQDPRLK